MEKYTVDLEKVLDEFEYEEQNKGDVCSSPVSNIYDYQSYRRQKFKPAPSNYRRPHFEAINLADADFARCMKIPSAVNGTTTADDGTIAYDDFSDQPVDDVIVRNKMNHSESLIILDNANEADETLIDYNLTSNGEEAFTIHHVRNEFKQPDLIGSNYDDFCSNELNRHDDNSIRHLPDVASANVENSKCSASNRPFDLICGNANEEIVEYSANVNCIVSNECSVSSDNVMKFDSISIDENKLHSYLEELDSNEYSVTNVNNVNSTDNGNDDSNEMNVENDGCVRDDGNIVYTFKQYCDTSFDEYDSDNKEVPAFHSRNDTSTNETIDDRNFDSSINNTPLLKDIANIRCAEQSSFDSQSNCSNSTDENNGELGKLPVAEESMSAADKLSDDFSESRTTAVYPVVSVETDILPEPQSITLETVISSASECEQRIVEKKSFDFTEDFTNIDSSSINRIDVKDGQLETNETLEHIGQSFDQQQQQEGNYGNDDLQNLDEKSTFENNLVSSFSLEERFDSTVISSITDVKEKKNEIIDQSDVSDDKNKHIESSTAEAANSEEYDEKQQSPVAVVSMNSHLDGGNQFSVNEISCDKEVITDASTVSNSNYFAQATADTTTNNSDFREFASNSADPEIGKFASPSPFKNEEKYENNCDNDAPTSSEQTDISIMKNNERDTVIKLIDRNQNFFHPNEASVAVKCSGIENNNGEHIFDDKRSTPDLADSSKLLRPTSLNIVPHMIVDNSSGELSSTSAGSGSLPRIEEQQLGKQPPFWVPDSEAPMCMQCNVKFTVIKRRHHCRGCGQVLCSKCCDVKAKLEYMNFAEARVCHCCYRNLERVADESDFRNNRKPNPNNPMEYCSTISPLLQVGPTHQPPPSVLVPVPVGVLKREGKPKNSDVPKKVIFSDGIRPGGDLTELDVSSETRTTLRKPGRISKRICSSPPGPSFSHKKLLNPETKSFIPSSAELPPVYVKEKEEFVYSELVKPILCGEPPLKYAINRNLFVLVSRVYLDCCVSRQVWCMVSEGLACVGQDEIVFIIEVLEEEKYPPKDIFFLVNFIHRDASEGSTVTEMTYLPSFSNNLLNSKEHGGFIFIRPTFQCCQKLQLPKPPFLVGILVHRWEAPWARLFPIRLVLRLGAEYRYYPSPLFSVRFRPSLFSDIGHTIIRLLADFKKYTFTLPTVQGLLIHMEDKQTTILLPKNRFDQISKALKNSDENVLTFAGNISPVADSHLVAVQSLSNDCLYQTQAINIHNKPRKVTGASFIIFNGSLKQCGWSGKTSIIEDGLMVHINNDSMMCLRSALKQMKDYCIGCGPQAEEMVTLKWCSDDTNFNIGVKSCIDKKSLDGVPSIRVHKGIDYSGTTRFIRWTEVFIIQSDDESNKHSDGINIKKLSESIGRATCLALLPYLDLLVTANLNILAVRATMDPDYVGYEAGSNGEKLPPLYMKSLDEQLIKVVNEAAVSFESVSAPVVLELIFRIMEQG